MEKYVPRKNIIMGVTIWTAGINAPGVARLGGTGTVEIQAVEEASGRAIAEELSSKGAFVIGTATSEKGADTISAYLGDKGKGLVLNVADKESIDAVLEQIKEQFGDIDILVNNAGITRDNLLMRMKDEEWFDIMQTNLTSVSIFLKHVTLNDEKTFRSYYYYRFSGGFNGQPWSI